MNRFLCTLLLLFSAGAVQARDVFDRENLVAWCIVPFDAKKRGPEERAQMLDGLGIRRLAYDYRAEHIPTFDAEVEAMKRHGIEFTAWWFPPTLNDEARVILGVIERHGIHPQLWVTGGGAPVRSAEEQTQRLEQEVARLGPIAEAAAKLGCKVALYNHGDWFGQPENQLALLDRLGRENVGIVYNFHHGHEHLARFPELWRKMHPRVLAVNLNGMVRDGDKDGRKILPIGNGTEELAMLRAIRESGWRGPVGILNHRAELDAEVALRGNLEGLEKLAAALAPSATAERPPNIVLICADDLGYADLGSYGAKGIATPHLDRLAREGRRFTDFHAAQPVCTASRAGLLTGCYPNRLGLHGALGPGSKIGLAASETTLAELLKSRGYVTAIFGKWHLGDQPQFLPARHGFDEFFGLPYSNDMWPHHPEARAGTYPPLPLFAGEAVRNAALTAEDQEQLTTQYAEHAVDFIERHAAQPFFLYLAPNMPHVPLYVSAKFRGKSARGIYGDVIMEIDWAVGEILGALAKRGLEDKTLVIFTSDNGPWLSYGAHAGSAGPLREGKGTSFEGGHRVPFIARWPARIPADTTCAELAMAIDLLPTLARLVGGELPAQRIDGRDIWPLLSAEFGARSPPATYLHYYGRNELQAVRSGRWKLFFPHQSRTVATPPEAPDGRPGKYRTLSVAAALYDLQTDLGETTDVAAKHPEIVQRLTALAEQARADLGDSLTGRTGHGAREPGR